MLYDSPVFALQNETRAGTEQRVVVYLQGLGTALFWASFVKGEDFLPSVVYLFKPGVMEEW